ncbi:MAG: chlorophyll synthesis pathway protein BchC [Wenzhouxiangellaceae bacterium]
MKTLAVVLEKPEHLALKQLQLKPPDEGDVVVDIDWSGISTGTERLLWTGTMPFFPGMGYPLVPGYESIGRIREAGPQSERRAGQFVFVPGATCYGEVRGLFGGASSRIVVPGNRVLPIDEDLGERGVLLALAATAYNAICAGQDQPCVPDLIVGHGVLGRLLARLALVLGDGAPPVVWEIDPQRAGSGDGYDVIHPDDDSRRDYRAVFDVSGNAGLLDDLISRLAPGGEIVLAGFYSDPIQFAFPPAFIRRLRMRIAAEWRQQDLEAVKRLAESGDLSLEGLISDRMPANEADAAYKAAFHDPACLKMILDWRSVQ